MAKIHQFSGENLLSPSTANKGEPANIKLLKVDTCAGDFNTPIRNVWHEEIRKCITWRNF